jgi:hypothetical protein
VGEKGSENKQFLGAGMKVVEAAGATVITLGVVFAGGKITGTSEGSSKGSQQDQGDGVRA